MGGSMTNGTPTQPDTTTTGGGARLSHALRAARHVVISANPKAGARSGRPAIEALSGALLEKGYEVETLTDIFKISQRAETLHAAGKLRAVVAAGGDGTAALVANRTPPGAPIAVLPLGTENLFARYIGAPYHPRSTAEMIDEGVAVRLDAGQANGQIFLLMAGIGFDAEVVQRLHANRRGHIHHLSYCKPIFDTVRRYNYPVLRIRAETVVDNKTVVQKSAARWTVVVNLPRYAGGLKIAPDATGLDGKLDVCSFRNGSLLYAMKYLAGIAMGLHTSWRDCNLSTATRILIESDQPVAFQVDGDPGGHLPVEIKVLAARLNMMVPAAFARAMAQTTPMME